MYVLLFGIFIGFSMATSSQRQENIVKQINNMKTSFTARHYKQFDGLNNEELLRFVGGSSRPQKVIPPTLKGYLDLEDDGDHYFSAAENWPACKGLIEAIPAQGNCSAAWAFAVTTSVQDRRCIQQHKDNWLSAWDLLTCGEQGCNGGDHDSAFQYLIDEGVVTGGLYQSHQGCKPYPLPPSGDTPINTKCVKKCTERSYKTGYADDKIKISNELIFQRNNKQVMAEIRKNGPVVAQFKVYEDFLTYSGGVYRHVTGKLIGYSYAKIVGWGVDKKGLVYWQAVGSFGADWGKQGMFRIVRGDNGCGFEENIIGGVLNEPSTKHTTHEPSTKQTTHEPSTKCWTNECSISLQNKQANFGLYFGLRPSDNWAPLITQNNFNGAFKLENVVGKCTKTVLIDSSSLDASLYSACLCCGNYNPDESLNCPSN